jgi:hypothetical protein
MINTYKQKYLKYKIKYNKLKFQIGGNKNRIEANSIYDTDPLKASRLYQQAIEEGDIESYHKLAKMYEKGHGVVQNFSEANKLNKTGYINTFNNFLVTMFNPKELNNKNKLYLLIGTYPYVFKTNEWKPGESYKMIENSIEYNLIIKDIIKEHKNKLIRDKCKNKEHNIQIFKYYIDEPLSEKEIELSNRIYYLIDIEYNEFYRNVLKLYLTTSSSLYDLSIYHLPIKFNIGDNFIRIEFTRLNIVIYIIEMRIPSEYNFDDYNLTQIDTNNPNQMSYTKNCTLSNGWNIFYCNLINFLKNSEKEFYLFNDALWYSGNYAAQNRYYEFFCELGYILYKLHENKKDNQVYVVLPNNRSLVINDQRGFESKKIDNNILPKFKKLDEIYKHNFGDEIVSIENRNQYHNIYD